MTDLRINVVGLGEVGRRIGHALAARPGTKVTGVDYDPERRRSFANSMPGEASLSCLQARAPEEILPADIHIIAVGTPLASGQVPDLSQLRAAVSSVASVWAPTDLVLVRSTVPIGTTRSLVLPGLTAFDTGHLATPLLAYAPDRALTGAECELIDLPQLIGATDLRAATRTEELFNALGAHCRIMESIEAAELAKLANNAARDVNIALANLLSLIAETWNLDIRRLISEACTDYPRNPIAHPSPGVGGSCLPKDSYLLESAAPLLGHTPTLFTAARKINESMPARGLQPLMRFIENMGDPRSCRILVCGIAFKGTPPTSDVRNSVGLEVARRLQQEGFDVRAHDPELRAEDVARLGLKPGPDDPLNDAHLQEKWTAILLYTDHAQYRVQAAQVGLRNCLSQPAYIFDPWQLVDLNLLKGHGVTYRGMSFGRLLA